MPAQKGNRHGAIALKRYWDNYDHTESRNKYIPLRVSESEFNYMTDKAEQMGISRVELVVRAVKAYDGEDKEV